MPSISGSIRGDGPVPNLEERRETQMGLEERDTDAQDPPRE